ncbi:MAG TPA: hypothetical protein VMU24_00990 [Candidatus Acidoferrales bacterium]|nr:hypothetical protein [Candidatus Acidoferrales bacterium]
MRLFKIAIFPLAFCISLFAQKQQHVDFYETHNSEAGKSDVVSTSIPRKDALALLKRTEQLVSGMHEPASRTLATVQLARAWQAFDRPHAVDLLQQAVQTASRIQVDGTFSEGMKRNTVQKAIQALVAVAPERADALLPELDPKVRARAMEGLLEYYREHKMVEHAVELVRGISAESEMPYSLAAKVADLLPREDDGQVRALFSDALTSYQEHDDDRYFNPGFPEMIVAVHERLAPSQVLDAIDEVLSKAKSMDEKSGDTVRVGLSSAKGAVDLNSRYDYRLFQLLPVLRQLDAGKAERLEKEDRTVKPLLAQYPKGPNSLSDGSKGSGYSMSFVYSDAHGSSGSHNDLDSPNIAEQQLQQRISADAAEHPQQALANVPLLSQPASRAQTYLQIAQLHWKNNASVSRSALTQLLQIIADVPADHQWNLCRKAAKLYMQMGDEPSARRLVEKGMTLASALYKVDTDADSPNTAPEISWPSANAWRSMLGLAATISPTWANDLLKEIDDEDMRALAFLSLAQTRLGVSSSSIEVSVFHKTTSTMYTYTED